MHIPKAPPPRVAIHQNLLPLTPPIREISTAEAQKRTVQRASPPVPMAGIHQKSRRRLYRSPENTALRSGKIEMQKQMFSTLALPTRWHPYTKSTPLPPRFVKIERWKGKRERCSVLLLPSQRCESTKSAAAECRDPPKTSFHG